MTESLAQAGTAHSMLYVPYLPCPDGLLRGNCLVSSIILDLVGDTLCTRSPDGEVRLHLLENCLHAPDGITHRFKLKKGITFHDGTEVTANDIVTLLTGPMHLAIDPSHYIARIKRTSRYGFDITATERGVDMLGYLARTAFTVRAPAVDQAAGNVFTGKFKIETWTPRAITFSAHKWQGAPEDTEQAEAWRLKLVAIGESGIDLFHSHPFSYAYLGHIFKEKPVGQLSHIKSERTESGCSYLIALRPDLPQREYIKERLTLASYLGFSRDRSFQRIPLESFFPKKHPLYAPFQKPARSDAQPAALRITLTVTDPTLSDKLLGIYHTACLNQGIHVTFTRRDEGASDGSIHAFFNSFLSPALDAVEFFSQEPLHSAVRSSPRLKELWRKVIKTPLVAKQERLLMSFLKDLVAAGPFVPLFYSFFVVKTNMPVTHKSSHQVTLEFNTNLAFAGRDSGQPVNADLEQFKTEALASLGQAIQMFAHDVKKPFSMMYSMLSLMANIEDGEQLKSLSRRYVSDVRGTMDTVTTMLSDIVEIGSDTVVHKESHSLRAILASVLWEVFAYSSDGPVSLHYDLHHYHKLHVDAPKITRVLSNILVNACQAMTAARHSHDFADAERITFTTKEVLHGKQLAVQLAIHNTGSVIPKDRLDAVFNLFFTQGKAKGTGLGLAICKKIILEHGGKIWAQSRETDSADQPAGTTFLMILPIAIDQMEDSSLRLPTSSSEFAEQLHTAPSPLTQKAAQREATPVAPSSITGNQEETVPDVLGTLGRAIKILIVDDEPMYLTLFSLLIESTDELSGHVQLHTAKNAFQALTMTEHIVPDIIVMDIDLGKLSDDGFEVVRKIRARGHRTKICIHSNRSWQDDQHLALKAEADFFLPKPMTKANIIRLIANGLAGHEDAPSVVKPAVLALLDDDPFVHDMLSAASHHLPWSWRSYTEDTALLTDLAPDESSPGAPLIFDAVLIDYYLGTEGDQGPEVARKVRQLQPNALIVLITDSSVVAESERAPFDAVLTKDAKAAANTLLNLLTSRDKTTDTQKN